MLSNHRPSLQIRKDTCSTQERNYTCGMGPQSSQSTSRNTYTAFLRSAVFPKHLDMSHCHTIPGLTHHPLRGQTPGLPPQAYRQQKTWRKEKLGRFPGRKRRNIPLPVLPQHTSPGRARLCQGQGEGREGDVRDRMTESSSTQPFVWKGPLGCLAQGGQVLLLPLQGERMRGGKQCSLLSC